MIVVFLGVVWELKDFILVSNIMDLNEIFVGLVLLIVLFYFFYKSWNDIMVGDFF